MNHKRRCCYLRLIAHDLRLLLSPMAGIVTVPHDMASNSRKTLQASGIFESKIHGNLSLYKWNFPAVAGVITSNPFQHVHRVVVVVGDAPLKRHQWRERLFLLCEFILRILACMKE
jgi:hypothetical protein